MTITARGVPDRLDAPPILADARRTAVRVAATEEAPARGAVRSRRTDAAADVVLALAMGAVRAMTRRGVAATAEALPIAALA